MNRRRQVILFAAVFMVALFLPAWVEAGPIKHTVQDGETLSGIALRYGVSVQVLADTNGISDPDMIRIGQTLTIPTGSSGSTVSTVSTTSAVSSSHQPSSKPTINYMAGGCSLGKYVVRQGDTLSKIARDQGTSVASLVSYNNIANPSLIAVGWELRIPKCGSWSP